MSYVSVLVGAYELMAFGHHTTPVNCRKCFSWDIFSRSSIIIVVRNIPVFSIRP